MIRKSLKFQEGDNMFLRVTLVTSVIRMLKSKNLTPRFVGPFQIFQRVGQVAYELCYRCIF